MEQSRVDAQRRQVTVLFADMAEYTPTSERIGEEAAFGLMQDLIERMSEIVHAHGGAVQNVTGDGLMALFGAPLAIEDAPLKACHSAIDIQEQMQALEDTTQVRFGVRPKFRIGLNTGPLVVGRVGDGKHAEITALGDTVNLAARLEGEAEPGKIVMSDATYRLVAGHVESEFFGERKIKGKSQPQRIHVLKGLKPDVSRFDVSLGRGLSPLIGRQSDIETLEQYWKAASAGALRIVDIVGEAGIGKSRLVHEFRQQLDPGKTIFLQGRCTAEGVATAFLPFIEIVRESFRVSQTAERVDVERRLSRGLGTLGMDVGKTLPYLLNLLGYRSNDALVNMLDSETVGVRTRNTLLELLRERRRISPVILFIDDLHWIDQSSAQLLRRLTESDPNLPLLLIRAYRPQFSAPPAEAGKTAILRLDELSRSGTISLLRGRLGVEDIPEPLVRLVAERSEGNPLFAEEIVSYLIENGTIKLTDGKASFEAAEEASVPVKLENLLMDRVDRLSEHDRAILQIASVIGPKFSQEVVASSLGLHGEVFGYLEKLERQYLLERETQSGVWRFKHVLLQEAVYNSLLRRRREELHEQIAEAIEASSRDHVDEVIDVLARHYSRAENDRKAVHYLALAGERSLTVYALEEAKSRFREAIRRIENNNDCADDRTLVDILLKLARALYFTISFHEIIAMVEKYLPIVERLGDEKRLARFLFETGYAHVFSGQHQIGKPMLERALAIGERIGDNEIIGYVSMAMIWHYANWEVPTSENNDKVRKFIETGLEIATDLKDHWLVSKILTGASVHYNVVGRPDLARQNAMGLIKYGRTTNDPRPRAMALWALAFLDAIYFNCDDAIVNADESIAIGLNPIDHACARCAKTVALTNLDRASEALECYRMPRSQLMEGGLILPLFASDPAKGVAILKNGDFAAGVAWIQEFQRWARELGNGTAAANADLYLGEIFLEMATAKAKPSLSVMRGNLWFFIRNLPFALRRARHHLEVAVKYYRDYNLPALLAWALVDLGRIHTAKRRSEDARNCLEEALPLARLVNEPALQERVDKMLAELPSW